MYSHLFRANVLTKGHSLDKQIDFLLQGFIVFGGHEVGRRRKKLVGVKVKSWNAFHQAGLSVSEKFRSHYKRDFKSN